MEWPLFLVANIIAQLNLNFRQKGIISSVSMSHVPKKRFIVYLNLNLTVNPVFLFAKPGNPDRIIRTALILQEQASSFFQLKANPTPLYTYKAEYIPKYLNNTSFWISC